MTQIKTNTLIYLPNKITVHKRMDGMLYQPKDAIQINGTIYNKWTQLDVFEDGDWVIRHIYLEHNEVGTQVATEAIVVPHVQMKAQSMSVN